MSGDVIMWRKSAPAFDPETAARIEDRAKEIATSFAATWDALSDEGRAFYRRAAIGVFLSTDPPEEAA